MTSKKNKICSTIKGLDVRDFSEILNQDLTPASLHSLLENPTIASLLCFSYHMLAPLKILANQAKSQMRSERIVPTGKEGLQTIVPLYLAEEAEQFIDILDGLQSQTKGDV